MQQLSRSDAKEYKYKVKLLVPRRKKTTTRYLHHWKKRFDCIEAMKKQITDELVDEIPDNPVLEVGYYEGRQSSKIWLLSNEDLKYMYDSKQGSEISLWAESKCVCDEESDEDEHVGRKKQKQATKRQSIETETDSIYKELSAKHSDSGLYSCSQLRLWARMINCGDHEDYDDPPRVPTIIGIPTPKQNKRESFAEALTGAAVAVAKVFAPKPKTPERSPIGSPSIMGTRTYGLSPGKCAELRMKNFQQLKYLQQLAEDNILSQSEFIEQKTMILEALKKLQ
ncbi:hypothetical protein SPONN_1314 [uncultured Candidatus Thioglobus sp.]|nr:hypothetical protein SPONN_1314 [uncultured Candidatus Thioglobus sp.]